LECYEEALKIDPNHIPPLVSSGQVLEDIHENSKAKTYFERDRSLNSSPNDPDIIVSKGKAFLKHDNAKQALECYEEALKIDPNHIIAMDSIGIALAKLGDFDKAITYYDMIMKRNPKDINALYSRANHICRIIIMLPPIYLLLLSVSRQYRFTSNSFEFE
jgi:tetratricopeptide (TPR) repeat protein